MLTRPRLPERISRLEELTNNLWWSWHDEARELFRILDYPLWRLSGHNPVKQLRQISPDKLQTVANDPTFLRLYDSVMATFDNDLSRCNAWYANKYPDLSSQLIAYFAAEFAIHNSLPIYAGGLGVLAGDTCKEASDLGIPLVAIGFMYPQGYFHQHISAEGWQEEIYHQLNFDEAPVNPCPGQQKCAPLAQIQLDDRLIYIGAWEIRLGCLNLYLLDTNLEENAPPDRQLSARLYIADPEQRLQQEIILGIGGVRALRALGLAPTIWHANEGHAAFMMLERVREEVERGRTFAEAVQRIQTTTVFTTHTPVPAGHDTFPIHLVEKYFHHYWSSLGIEQKTFLRLGQADGLEDQPFNMTVLALKMAGQRNAVSQLHGVVTRKMWHHLWPQVRENEVPITHITNGIHVPTWLAPELSQLYDKYLGREWLKKQDEPNLWQRIADIPNEELWLVRQLLKRKLIHIILERAQERWTESEVTPQQVLAMGAMLDHDVLTIGFVRRFTEYKRPALIFYDLERLKKMVKDRWRPVQIIFAGKSHPADFASKHLLRQVYSLAADRQFQGRIAFVEDYDMHMAHYLVQGVDVWLNNPRRLQEACGTSGMKAALNGALHLSVRDGWWHEGYNGQNGWAIGDGPEIIETSEQDKADAEALYHLLEEKIIPLYYERDRKGVPQSWMEMVKESVSSIVPTFSARRMLKEYTERLYQAAIQSLENKELL